jgi:signal transduction histidine kinase
MSKNSFVLEDEQKENNLVAPISILKKSIEIANDASFLCEIINDGYPNIIHVNQKFCDLFQITAQSVVDNNYEYVLGEISADNHSRDQIEYIRLIKAVKNFQSCSIIMSIGSSILKVDESKFKIIFTPNHFAHQNIRYCIFSFEKIEHYPLEEDISRDESNKILVRNLEKTIRIERVLRQVSYSIISDLSVVEISKNIAKIICDYLKADRCVINNLFDDNIGFISEYCLGDTKKMIKNDSDENGKKLTRDYIKFNCNFYKRIDNGARKTMLMVVDNPLDDFNFRSVKEICELYKIGSQIIVITSFNNKINGGIYIHQAQRRSWLPDELDMIEMIGEQLSLAIDREFSVQKVVSTNLQLEEVAKKLQESLLNEQEMRKTQNEFIGLVSHEFKTPLQIIDGARELLIRKLKNVNLQDVSISDVFDRMKNGVQRINNLIHTTLNLTKMESVENPISIEKQNFNLKKITKEIIEKSLILANSKNIKIETDIENLPDQFHADPKMLDHVISNIISNAIKYSHNNSLVKIISKVINDNLQIIVIDQGIGIPKEDLLNVGKKFFRAKNTNSFNGTGVGIYLSKYFLELHKGSFLIESEFNLGTSVTINLPINL